MSFRGNAIDFRLYVYVFEFCAPFSFGHFVWKTPYCTNCCNLIGSPLFAFAVSRLNFYSLAKRIFFSRNLICLQHACVHLFRAKFFAFRQEISPVESALNTSHIFPPPFSSKDLPNMNTFCDWLFETIVTSFYDSFFRNYISIVLLSFIVFTSQPQRLFI